MGHELQRFDGIIVLEGLFFLRPYLIKSKSDFVQKTFQGLFEYVNFN